MGDERFREHVDRLVADAEREAAAGDWKAARALAEAALILQADEARGRAVLRRAQTALARVGERRQLTVMFCDVVGSTGLSSEVDPEIVREILRSYQSTCVDAVVRYEGHVANYLGDGIVAYFGYPQIHEDDAERAVRAGLELLEMCTELTASVRRRYDLPFSVRVAVHTGLVVRAEMGGPGRPDIDAVVGATPNVAARLQEHARPGSLVISSSTYELVRGAVSVKSLGPLTLRGVPGTVEAFEVVGLGSDGALPETPFCDRTAERALLDEAWAELGDGFRVFVVTGDAGIGKSRLVAEFQAVVDAAGGTTVQCACSSFHTSTALYPARQLVEAACEVDSRDDPSTTLPKLRAALADIGKEHLVGVFADLLGIPPGAGWEAPEMEGPQLRELTLSTMVEWIATAAAATPVLVIIDDLQWVDPSTLELIGRVVRRHIPGLFVVLTAREFTPPWAEATVIHLDPLPESHLREMIAGLPEAKRLDDELIDSALDRSEGVPLYLEELIRAAGSEPVDLVVDAGSTVPPGLRDPLLARLGAPGVDLSLCQALATIGREADHEVLATLLGLPDDVLDARLRVLVDARILEAPHGEHGGHRFRHQLLRELAYDTQLRADRRRLHGAIADILDALDVHGLPSDAGAIGYHLEAAGRIPAAIEAYTATARKALAHGAFTEGIDQLERCLELAGGLGDARERSRLELSVRQVLGMSWASNYGYSNPTAVEQFRRCAELCEELGADAGPVPSIEAIWYYYSLRGELDKAEEIVAGRRRLDLGPNPLPEEGARCAIRFLRGDMHGAISDLESFLESPYAKHATDVPVPWPLPDDPVVNSWTFLGLARSWTCDVVGSRDAFEQARARAALLPYPHGPFGLAYVYNLEVLNARLLGCDDEADGYLEELSVIADRHGFTFFTMAVAAQRTIGGARRGGPASDVSSLVMMSELMGVQAWEPSLRLEEGWMLLRDGQADAALGRADATLAKGHETGVRFLEAEAYRLRGLARVAAGDDRGSEDLDRAAEVARSQGLTLWELRALLARSAAPGVPGADRARHQLSLVVEDLVAADIGAERLSEVVEARDALALG